MRQQVILDTPGILDLKRQFVAAWLVVLACLVTGCASPNVNPAKPAPKMGYVDFITNPDEDVALEVQRLDSHKGEYKTAFLDIEPLPDGILRLAFPPGREHLKLTVVNRATFAPVEIEVEIAEGKVTPLRLELEEAGTTIVSDRDVRVGSTAYGRYGRRTKVRLGEENKVYKLNPKPMPPLEYRVKSEMKY